ncbi:hypothetical protein B0H10DRAFT_2240210 [Mycena sp. CBHHK59/15]|nr:hypothetical protein B0H10DRAFT_2240210 [Mycena sp. CBHHK59/15]
MAGMVMMKTYLHFTPGDTVIFQTIVPKLPGGMVGACVILFLISVADHYLRAVCRGLEARFIQRTKRLTTAYYFVKASDASGKSSETPQSVEAEPSKAAAGSSKFILSHELSHGAISRLLFTLSLPLLLTFINHNPQDL